MRMALERLRWPEETRVASIWRIKAATDMPSTRAISLKASQNSGSRETLVACLAITTDLLSIANTEPTG